MSYTFYKTLHLVSMMALFLGFGVVIALAMARAEQSKARILGAILSGVGLLLALVSGFGMQAKGNLGFPNWLLAKIGIWVLIGGMTVLIKRVPNLAWLWWILLLALGAAATWLALYRPF